MRPTTTFAGDNPFTPVICNDEPPALRARTKSKYDTLFSGMTPGQAVKCSKKDIGTIAAALRSHVRQGHVKGLVRTTRDFGDGLGRVWLIKGK
jgi:hypothetical protein